MTHVYRWHLPFHLRGCIIGRLVAVLFVAVGVMPNQESAAQVEGDYVYNITLLRASPGHFNDLIDVLREQTNLLVGAGDAEPFWVRHSQGDHWDFMLIYPVGDPAQYFSSGRLGARRAVWSGAGGIALSERLDKYTAYHEEWYAASVSLDEMVRRFNGMDFYHIEMFAGIPGKREELLRQRRMENRYYEVLDRQQNLIFTRVGGSNWDAMTIGFYEDIQAYVAAGARYSEQEQDDAAKAAGFSGVNDIGPYLRSLLSYHNDTLGVRAE